MKSPVKSIQARPYLKTKDDVVVLALNLGEDRFGSL